MMGVKEFFRIKGLQSSLKCITSIMICLFLATSLAACSGYRPAPMSIQQAPHSPYILNAGDQLRITVFDQENLSNNYAVDQSGNIAFPLVGSVPARGKTVKQVEAYIASKLAGGYLRNPNVTAEVSSYRAIFIMGEVNDAGQYTYVPGMTAQKAIASAGGFSPRAYQADIDVTREINNKIITGRMKITEPILPGDTIYIRERLF